MKGLLQCLVKQVPNALHDYANEALHLVSMSQCCCQLPSITILSLCLVELQYYLDDVCWSMCNSVWPGGCFI